MHFIQAYIEWALSLVPAFQVLKVKNKKNYRPFSQNKQARERLFIHPPNEIQDISLFILQLPQTSM